MILVSPSIGSSLSKPYQSQLSTLHSNLQALPSFPPDACLIRIASIGRSLMISNFAWIGSIDHRISAAVVFFVLMLLLNSGEKQPLFPLRAAASFAVMAAVSWVIRSLADVWAPNIHIQALGYSLQLLALHLLFVGASLFCYRVRQAVLIYNSLLALTIFKIAWNSFKTGSSILLINSLDAPWGQYSIAGSLVSYLTYFSVCLLHLLLL